MDVQDFSNQDAIEMNETFWIQRFPNFFDRLAKLISYRAYYGHRNAEFLFDNMYTSIAELKHVNNQRTKFFDFLVKYLKEEILD